MQESNQEIIDNQLEADHQALQELFVACNDYHNKHFSGAGGQAICSCGAASGGSSACRALSLIREVFTYVEMRPANLRQKQLVEIFQREFQ